MPSSLDRDLIEHARQQLTTLARQYVHQGMGPASAARAAIRETRALFPHDWQLGVQGDDDDTTIEVWEITHKYSHPVAVISHSTPTTLTPIQLQHLAIIRDHGGHVRRSAFGGWLDGVRGLRLPVIEELVRAGVLTTSKITTSRRSARSRALPSTITTYTIVEQR